MESNDLNTGADVTWCPGCNNFMLLSAVRKALKTRAEEKDIGREDFSMAAGIGCHGKMFDYLDIGGVYSLHGRVIPTMVGMKMGNPNLEVIGFGGDGDTYSEGVSHFIHASRLNPDMTMVVHNNEIYALTTGQATPTTKKGFETKAQPKGHFEEPLNPIELAVSNNTSFVARVDASNITMTQEVLEKAMSWEGYAFVDVVMPCLKYNMDIQKMKDKFYRMDEKPDRTKSEALEKAAEWNSQEGDLPLGIFYRNRKETMSEKRNQLSKLKEENKGWFQR